MLIEIFLNNINIKSSLINKNTMNVTFIHGSKKYPYTPHGRSLETDSKGWGGGEVLKYKKFKVKENIELN